MPRSPTWTYQAIPVGMPSASSSSVTPRDTTTVVVSPHGPSEEHATPVIDASSTSARHSPSTPAAARTPRAMSSASASDGRSTGSVVGGVVGTGTGAPLPDPSTGTPFGVVTTVDAGAPAVVVSVVPSYPDTVPPS